MAASETGVTRTESNAAVRRSLPSRAASLPRTRRRWIPSPRTPRTPSGWPCAGFLVCGSCPTRRTSTRTVSPLLLLLCERRRDEEAPRNRNRNRRALRTRSRRRSARFGSTRCATAPRRTKTSTTTNSRVRRASILPIFGRNTSRNTPRSSSASRPRRSRRVVFDRARGTTMLSAGKVRGAEGENVYLSIAEYVDVVNKAAASYV